MMVLEKDKFESSIGIVIKAANTDVIEDIEKLAAAVKSDGDNDMKEKLLECCKKFQTVYNESFKPSMDGLIDDFQAAFDITEMIAKADVGDVSSLDASFKSKNVDPASVRL